MFVHGRGSNFWFQIGRWSPAEEVHPSAVAGRNPFRVVPQCRGRLPMAQLLAHVEQGRPGRQEQAGKTVSEIVNTEVWKLGGPQDAGAWRNSAVFLSRVLVANSS